MSNGALIQVVKSSRVLYGLAQQGELPQGLARIDERTRTPLHAAAVVTLVVLVLALAFPLGGLGKPKEPIPAIGLENRSERQVALVS
jgi:APA family basic amino acid/polyamine antiporter